MMKTTQVTTGCVLVHDEKSNEAILVGCISEVLKYMMEKDLFGVKLLGIVLSDTRVSYGVSNWAFEFPLYKQLFVDQGLKDGWRLAIVGTEAQIAAAREIVRITLLGATKGELRRWANEYDMPGKLYQELYDMTHSLRLAGTNGEKLELDEMVDFKTFEDGVANVGQFKVCKDGKLRNKFALSYGDGEEAEVRLTFKERPKPPFKLAQSDKLPLARVLGLYVLMYGNGFSRGVGCTSFVVWVNGVPILFDAAPFCGQALTAYGLNADQLGGVVITHPHDDHCSLLEIQRERGAVDIYATPEVYEAVLVKIGALLDLDPKHKGQRKQLTNKYRLVRVDCKEASNMFGVTYQPHYCAHSIITTGGRFTVEQGGERRQMLLGGDNVGFDRLDKMFEDEQIAKHLYERLRNMVQGDEDLVLLDAGADVAKLHADPEKDSVLQKLSKKMGHRLLYGHRAPKEGTVIGTKIVSAGDELVVVDSKVAPDTRHAYNEAMAKLGVTDDNTLESLLHQGEEVTLPYQRGRAVVDEGQDPEFFYVVTAGQLEVQASGKELARIGPGMFFGEMGILQGKPCNASIVPLSSVRLFKLPREKFAYVAVKLELRERLEQIWANRGVVVSAHVFSKLRAETAWDLAGSGRRIDLEPGSMLIENGSTTTSVYIVSSGTLEAEVETPESGKRVVARYKKGEIIGEMAALTGAPRSANVIARSAATVFEISADRFRELDATVPEVSHDIRMLVEERRNGFRTAAA